MSRGYAGSRQNFDKHAKIATNLLFTVEDFVCNSFNHLEFLDLLLQLSNKVLLTLQLAVQTADFAVLPANTH